MLSGKYSGYGMDLYRSRDDRWLAGVCGGLAEHMNMPGWLVRLGFITLFLFTGSFAILLYIAAVVMLAKRPARGAAKADAADRYRPGEPPQAQERNLKDALFSYGPSPSGRVAEINERMRRIDEKLRRMEGYVTSRKFQFDREMKRS